MVRAVKRWIAFAAVTGLFCATGCHGFFPPLTDTGGGSTGTTNTGDFVYVANSFTSTVTGTSSVYSITGFTVGSGSLAAISGATESLVVAPNALVVTPSNGFLYVAASGVIYGYSISSTGTLTQLLNASGGQALANANIVSMVVSPDGQWLLGLDSNPSAVVVDEFQISSTGQLTLEAGAQYALTSGATIVASNLAVSPLGDYLAASLGTGGEVVFGFATGTGVVTPEFEQFASTSSSGDQAAVFNSTSSTLYVAVSGTNGGVYPYTIGNAGTLTAVTGAPFSLGTGSTTAGPASMVIDKTGSYLYVGNRTANSISGFSIASGGVLTALSGSPYAAGTTVSALGYDNSGNYILSTASGGTPDLEMFSFDATAAGKLNAATTGSTGNPTEPAGAVAIALTH
jgi:6-phosphogluconolactonase